MAKNRLGKLGSKSGNHIHLIDIEPPINYDSYKPAFSFRYMTYGGDKCLSKCDPKSKSSISDTLLRLSQIPWKEIPSKAKGSLGFEKIPSTQFNYPLPQSVTPDVTMLVLRFSKSGRIAGFREKDIYHIVQVSPNHDLY